MGIMTNRNTCSGKLVLILAALVVLLGHQPGLAEDQEIEQFRQAAEQGEAWAQLALGYRYHKGEGISQDDREAAKWFRLAAERGLPEAQNALGSLYITGKGVPQNYLKATKWYRKAAKQGLAEAQVNLGSAYGSGDGVSQDYQQAVKWYRKAAEQGLAEAQVLLGFKYYFGEGVPRDKVKAHAWMNLATSSGNPDFAKTRDRLATTMTRKQITEAQALATELARRIEVYNQIPSRFKKSQPPDTITDLP
jgi:hypothetical protein